MRHSLPGSARIIVDQGLPGEVLQIDCFFDGPDAGEQEPYRDIDFVAMCLQDQFPGDPISELMDTARRFFSFRRNKGEHLEASLTRFGKMIDEVSPVLGLRVCWGFSPLMVLQVLGLSQQQLIKYLGDCGGRLPEDPDDHITLQQLIQADVQRSRIGKAYGGLSGIADKMVNLGSAPLGAM